MPNTFEYATWLAMECLDLLETKRGLSQYYNTDYNGEFKKSFAVGDSVNVPFPAQFTVRNGLEYNPQAVTRRHATITFDEPFGVDFEWDSAEAYLRAPKGRDKIKREILDPAMAQLAQEIDSRCALYAYQNTPNVTGAIDTAPTTYDTTSAACRQIMQEYGCPDSGDRCLVVNPKTMRGVKAANIGYYNPQVDLSKQFRKGYVSYADGFDWFESMSLYKHTCGTYSGAASMTSAPANGATELKITLNGSSDIVNKGDKIAIASVLPVHPLSKRVFGTATKQFTVTERFTGATAATIKISPAVYFSGPYQNVDSQPQASAGITFWPGTTSPTTKAGLIGLALHKNAFALVGSELEEPKGSSVELVSQQRDPDSGIAVRFIRQWDNRASKFINRFDVMIGFGTFYNDACSVALCLGTN